MEKENFKLNMTIENNSDKKILVATLDTKLNGKDCFSSLLGAASGVEAGKTKDACLTFTADRMDSAGVKTVKDVEFTLEVYDMSMYQWISEPETIKIKVSK